MRQLVEACLNVESKDSEWERTPLSFMTIYGHLEVVKFLVNEASADIKAKDQWSKMVLDWVMAAVGWEKHLWGTEAK